MMSVVRTKISGTISTLCIHVAYTITIDIELRCIEYKCLHLHFRSVGHANECVAEQVWVVTLIRSPLEFVKIGVKMLGGNLMIRSDDGTLEKRPDAFNPVGVYIAANPLFGMMVYRFVAGVFVCNPEVSRRFIRHQSFSLWIGCFFHESMQNFLTCLFAFLDAKADF